MENEKNIKILCGGKVVVISPKNNDKIIIPFHCPVCEYPMKQADDAESYRSFTCCSACDLFWMRSKKNLPSKDSEEWKAYLDRRHLIFLPRINLV